MKITLETSVLMKRKLGYKEEQNVYQYGRNCTKIS